MSTLVKFSFWFGLVLFLMPLADTSRQPSREVSPLEALFAAKGAVDDARGLCMRRPDVCETGGAVFEKIGISAGDAARAAAAMLDASDRGDAADGETTIEDLIANTSGEMAAGE